ncbi:hypothetical protein J4714_12590 [Staphylococcus epidermidis]|nr:hypothetical protein [Staphylococcus epidermidis]
MVPWLLSDGKADNKLAFATWSLARRFGREDDYYVLNLLTGSIDRFVNLVAGKHPRAIQLSQPLQRCPADLHHPVDGIHAPPGGRGFGTVAGYGKAMMSALINALCYARPRRTAFVTHIQKNMSLPAMAALYVEAKKNGWHSELRAWKVIWKIPRLPAGQREYRKHGEARLRTA